MGNLKGWVKVTVCRFMCPHTTRDAEYGQQKRKNQSGCQYLADGLVKTTCGLSASVPHGFKQGKLQGHRIYQRKEPCTMSRKFLYPTILTPASAESGQTPPSHVFLCCFLPTSLSTQSSAQVPQARPSQLRIALLA